MPTWLGAAVVLDRAAYSLLNLPANASLVAVLAMVRMLVILIVNAWFAMARDGHIVGSPLEVNRARNRR